LITKKQLEKAMDFLSRHNPKVGEVARSTSFLSSEQVERVLERQAQTGERFGQAAVSLGFLSEEELERLLEEQRSASLCLGHALFLTGALEADRLVNEMARFDSLEEAELMALDPVDWQPGESSRQTERPSPSGDNAEYPSRDSRGTSQGEAA